MFYALAGLLNALSSSVLGIIVYAKNPKRRINKTFALFSVLMALWSYCYFFWLTSHTEHAALLWSRLLMAAAIFIPVSYLHFVLVFAKEIQIKRARTILFVGYFVFFLFLIADFTPCFVANVEPKMDFIFWPSAGPLYAPFLVIWFFYAVYSIYVLYKSYRHSTGVKKIQLSYILLGTIIGYLGGATNYLLWYDIPVPPVGNWAITLYMFLVAYSILKYHLFDVRVIAAELLTFAIWIFLLIRTALSETIQELFINLGLFATVLVIGILLIKSVWKEVEQREKLEVLTHRLQKLGEIKTQFVIATQHHIRGPLTAMRGYLDLISEGSYGKVPKKIGKVLSDFGILTARLLRVVNELLDISQFRLGKEAFMLRPNVKIEAILKEIIEELQLEAKTKGLYLKFQSSRKSPQVKVDLEKLKVALFNLIDNGLKYTTKGGVTIEVTTTNLKVKIAIKDTGVGIPEEEQKTLFTRIFERGKEAKKTHRTGRGIGLYITSQIIKAHKGKIWAESEGKGQGSTFYVELPV